MKLCDEKIYGDAAYTKRQNIEKITDYLHGLKLASASDEELPNMSADASITYYNKANEKVKTFIIYGQVFIKDLENGTLYRVKYNSQIISGIENLPFEQ